MILSGTGIAPGKNLLFEALSTGRGYIILARNTYNFGECSYALLETGKDLSSFYSVNRDRVNNNLDPLLRRVYLYAGLEELTAAGELSLFHLVDGKAIITGFTKNWYIPTNLLGATFYLRNYLQDDVTEIKILRTTDIPFTRPTYDAKDSLNNILSTPLIRVGNIFYGCSPVIDFANVVKLQSSETDFLNLEFVESANSQDSYGKEFVYNYANFMGNHSIILSTLGYPNSLYLFHEWQFEDIARTELTKNKFVTPKLKREYFKDIVKDFSNELLQDNTIGIFQIDSSSLSYIIDGTEKFQITNQSFVKIATVESDIIASYVIPIIGSHAFERGDTFTYDGTRFIVESVDIGSISHITISTPITIGQNEKIIADSKQSSINILGELDQSYPSDKIYLEQSFNGNLTLQDFSMIAICIDPLDSSGNICTDAFYTDIFYPTEFQMNYGKLATVIYNTKQNATDFYTAIKIIL